MGNGYNNQSIQQHHLHQKNIFLPMFCRLSINDINLNNHNNKNRIVTDDPSSPKVSCIGQVKRNNRVTGFPAVTATTTATATHHHKNTKLKKVFSSKALLPPSTSKPSATAAGAARRRSESRSCRTSSDTNSRKLKLKNDCDWVIVNCNRIVNIGEMDPPLPVVKKVAAGEVNIWKRRFSGSGLKGLQIEQVHLPNYKVQLPTTV